MTAGLCNVIKLQLFFSLTGLMRGGADWSIPPHTACMSDCRRGSEAPPCFTSFLDKSRDLINKAQEIVLQRSSATETRLEIFEFILETYKTAQKKPHDVKQFPVCRVFVLISMFSLYEGVLSLPKCSPSAQIRSAHLIKLKMSSHQQNVFWD